MDIDYCEDDVLRVDFISSFTGVFAETVCVLSRSVDVYYGYIAEDGCLIFETSSIDKAISVLCS